MLNPSNWQLTDNGVALVGGASTGAIWPERSLSPGLGARQPSNKYEAVVTFDGDSTTAGNQALEAGDYMLTHPQRRAGHFRQQVRRRLHRRAGQRLRPGVHRRRTGGGGGGGGGKVTPPGNPDARLDRYSRQHAPHRLDRHDSPDVAADAERRLRRRLGYQLLWRRRRHRRPAIRPLRQPAGLGVHRQSSHEDHGRPTA